MLKNDQLAKTDTLEVSGENPYVTPTVETLLNPEKLGAKDLRQRFIREEMTVLAVGWFFYFMGSVLVGTAIVALWVFFTGMFDLNVQWRLLAIILFNAGALYLITGFGLRRFDSWARMPALIAAVASVVFLPIGILASPVCFVLLKNNAVKDLFTPEYQTAVVAEGEMIQHYGWLAVLGGLLTSVTLFAVTYFLSQGYL